MCLQCMFTNLFEYMHHITLIINKRMCQLPPGNQESRICRWVRRLGISVAVQASPLPTKGILTSPYSWGETTRTRRIPTANIQRGANWTQLSGARRAQRKAVYCPVVHMRTACLLFPQRYSEFWHHMPHLRYDKSDKCLPV